MIESVCKHCNLTTRDGVSIAAYPFCPASLSGERFPCEPKTAGDFMIDRLARGARNRAVFGSKKRK